MRGGLESDHDAALAVVRAANATTAVVVPPRLLAELRAYPAFAKLIDEGKIIPNLPLPEPDNA